MTTVIAAGGEMGAFSPSDGSIIEGEGGGALFGPGYDPAYARCCIVIGETGGFNSYTDLDEFDAQQDVWVHFVYRLEGGPPAPLGDQQAEYVCFQMLDDGNDVVAYMTVAAVRDQAGVIYRLYAKGASGFTFIGTLFRTSVGAALHTFDVHLSATSCAVYVAGTRHTVSTTEDISGVVNMTRARFWNTYDPPQLSEVIVADGSTISWRLQTLAIVGGGDTDDWTGVYTDINEIPYNDGTFIYSTAANQVSLYSILDTVVNNIRAVVVTARATKGAAGPQHLALALKSGAGVYFSGAKALSAGYTANEGIWMTDPNGTIPWTPDSVEAIQYGVKSIA